MRISRALSSGAGVFALAAMPLLAQQAMRPVLPRITQAIDGTELFPLKGNTHPLARAAYDQGAAPPDLPMERILLLLRRGPEQEAALKQLLEEQQDPASVNYHHWLTPEQFGEQFGPALEDTDRITGWLKSQGFRVDGVANGRNVVEFSGTAAQVERALHTQIHSYFVDGEQHWANAQDPQIPAALSPVVAGIVSLHNFRAKALHHRAGAFRKTPGDSTWMPAGLAPEYTLMVSGMLEGLVGPYDFATIYNVLPLWNAGVDGTGQRIAVAGRSNIALQDVRNFRSVFGLPALDPIITLNGPDPGTANVDDEFENIADVEWAGAIAKGAAINLVVSKSTTATDGSALSAQYSVNNNLAPVLNVSYGKCEMLMTTATSQFYNSLWQQAAAQGITVVVASGDGGSADCDQNGSSALFGLQVNGIASTPYNVAIGGTDFSDFSSQTSSSYWNSSNAPGTLESAKSYVPEMTWNDSCASPQVVSFFGPDAGVYSAEALCNDSSYMKQVPLLTVASGGGGASSLYSKPSWQSGVGGIPSDGHRDLPDVSVFAGDGMWLHYYVVCQADNQGPCNPSGSGGLVATGGGGTSFGAPAFSGIMALVNQKTGSRQGLANPALYQLAAAEYGSSSSPNSGNLQVCNASSPQGSGNACVFYDVTAGSIDVPCLSGLLNCYASNPSDLYGLLSTSSTSLVTAYAAGTGYDLATGLGSFNAANLVNQWTSTPLPQAVLSIGKSHTGNFAQGQTSATYTVRVSNGASAGPTSGAVTVTENPPTGLTLVSMAGSGWSCTGSTCTRSDVLSPGSSYPAITVTVNVASNAPSQVTNQVTVSGGGSGSATGSDVTVIGAGAKPVLSISKTHAGNFAQGQTSATYTVRVSNGASAGPTSGAVTVTENPPTGLTLVSMTGSGWSCTGSTCTRSDVLSPGSSYPAITVTVNVASNAPSQVTNQVTVSGGGSGSATASDFTNISTHVLIPTTTAVTASPSTIATTASTTLTAAVTAASGTPTGTVAFNLGSTVLNSATLTVTGGTAQATLVVNGSRLAVGTNSITATYSGDGNYSVSAASVTVTVTQSTLTPSGYMIGTVAGNGIAGPTGDLGLATSAELNGPDGVAMDSAGNLFIADYYNNRVRKVTPAGTITTVAGTGDDGFGGDLGPAISARLSHPSGIAVDSAGNLFIADYMNNRIRMVTPGGTISTVAGNGTEGYNGDNIPATSAELWLPTGVAVDGAGNLFIAELTGYRIRKVTPAGTISTVAGNGSPGYNDGPATSAGLSFPSGVAVDSTGNIFIADRGNNFIRKVTPAGMMSRVAGNGNQGFSGDGGPATSAALSYPTGVAVDSAGDLFIADAGNNLIRKVSPDGTISTVAGNRTSSSGGDLGPATSAGISSPHGVIVDNAGNLFIADFGNNKIRKLTPVAPVLNITSVTNGASFQNGFASATWVSIFGANLSQTTRLWQDSDFVNGLLPTSLSGVSVTINGLPAYVEYISPTQVNVLAPDDAAVGAVQAQVTTAQGRSNSFTAQKQQFAPAFFTMGGTYAAAQHADYSYVGKPGLTAGATPAKPGETILIYATGFGPTSPPVSSSQLVTASAVLANPVQFTIGGVTAHVDYAGLVGAGLYQFNVRVPDVPSGDAAVVAQIGGVQTQTGVLITIEGSPTPAPQIISVNPASGQVGTTVALTISGSNLSGVTAVQFSPSAGITVSKVSATATQVTATATIDATAAVGSRNVFVASPAGTSNSVAFTVQAPPAPQITSLNPASGQVGTAVALTISGSNLSGVTAVQFSPSTGITVSNVNATATQVTATVTIAVSAATGSRTVSVSSPAGTSNAVAFTIQAVPLPQITSLNPASGQVGTTVALTISGSNLSGVMTVQFSPSTGITVSNVNATATQVTATVTIAASAAAGSRTVSVSSPAGNSNAVGFTISSGPGPYDGQWSGSTSQGKSFSMTIAGNVLTLYSYGLNYPNLGSNCPTSSTTTGYPSYTITGSSFSTSSISGTFQSATQASGTVYWSLSIPSQGCTGSGSVTWQANKN